MPLIWCNSSFPDLARPTLSPGWPGGHQCIFIWFFSWAEPSVCNDTADLIHRWPWQGSVAKQRLQHELLLTFRGCFVAWLHTAPLRIPRAASPSLSFNKSTSLTTACGGAGLESLFPVFIPLATQWVQSYFVIPLGFSLIALLSQRGFPYPFRIRF